MGASMSIYKIACALAKKFPNKYAITASYPVNFNYFSFWEKMHGTYIHVESYDACSETIVRYRGYKTFNNVYKDCIFYGGL